VRETREEARKGESDARRDGALSGVGEALIGKLI